MCLNLAVLTCVFLTARLCCSRDIRRCYFCCYVRCFCQCYHQISIGYVEIKAHCWSKPQRKWKGITWILHFSFLLFGSYCPLHSHFSPPFCSLASLHTALLMRPSIFVLSSFVDVASFHGHITHAIVFSCTTYWSLPVCCWVLTATSKITFQVIRRYSRDKEQNSFRS